ncbi:dethiobiotin synthase [bacterium]|nr:dethiobiotin synthase [bacterium]
MKETKIKSAFICGTDTGVGKTIITASMAAASLKKGQPVAVYKPLESGRARADSTLLKKMSGMNEKLSEINTFFFKNPLAPGVAAEIEKKNVSLTAIKKQFKVLEKKYGTVLVEGAGGLIVPVWKNKTNLDLIKFLDIPVILVGRLGLGTINHTLLTLEHLKRNKIKVAGVILNQTTKKIGLAEKTNPEILKKMGVKLWGIFPYLQKIDQKTLALHGSLFTLQFLPPRRP